MNYETVLGETVSLCPECLKRVDAKKVSRDGNVYLEKACGEHGAFSTLIWRGSGYEDWGRELHPVEVSPCETEVIHGCPYDCGICAQHAQKTCCVLFEVTSKCNLRCPVCFASAGEAACVDPPIEAIEGWFIKLLETGGPYNIQLSGGEPTVRDDIPEIIAIGARHGYPFFQLNTNGLRIASERGFAKKLASAGLNCVFLQFDGLNDEIYKKIRGCELLDIKKRAIMECADAGLGVVLVPTVVKGINDCAVGEIIEFAWNNTPAVRGVHFQPMSFFGRYEGQFERYTLPDMLRDIELQTNGAMKWGDFSPGGAENPYCSFSGNFMRESDGAIKPWIQKSEGDCCCGSSQKSRAFVAKRWSGGARRTAPIKPDAFDEFLYRLENHSLSVSCMVFQDAWNIDLDRLKYCYINEISPDGNRIPFCAYNLTSTNGKALYRNRKCED